MKHVCAISKSPGRAQLGTEDIITIVVTSVTAITTLLSTILPLVTNKE